MNPAGAGPRERAWLRRYHHLPEPTARLVCFPHAGGAGVSTGPFDTRAFPGGHFYLRDCRRDLVATLVEPLGAARAGALWPMLP